MPVCDPPVTDDALLGQVRLREGGDAERHVLEPFATAGGGDDDVRGVGRGVGAFCGRGVCGTIVIGGRGTGLGGGRRRRDDQFNPRLRSSQAVLFPSFSLPPLYYSLLRSIVFLPPSLPPFQFLHIFLSLFSSPFFFFPC